MEYPIFSGSMFSSQLKLAGLAEFRALRRWWFFWRLTKFGTTTCILCHTLPSGVICRANVLPEHKRTARESLFCLTAELWLWTVAFLLTVLATWSLISLPTSQCNRQLKIFFKANQCHVAHRMINYSQHSGIFKEEKHSLEKIDAKQFLLRFDTEGNLQNITLDPKVRSLHFQAERVLWKILKTAQPV